MSQTANKQAAQRWLATAEQDLAAALTLQAAQHHPQACFLAQQAAEKALKAVWYWLDRDPWGHSVHQLLRDCPGSPQWSTNPELQQAAVDLDKCYIPTRYPNGLPDLTPHEAYTQRDSAVALAHARLILDQASQALS